MRSRIAIVFAFLLLATSSSSAFGDDAADLKLPDGYTTIDAARCRFILPVRNSAVVEKLLPSCDNVIERIFRQVGVADSGEGRLIEVRIVSEPEQMILMTPGGSVPPEWSSALSFPEFDVVVLPLMQRDGMPIEDLNAVLEHELSHLALRKALKGEQVPRWFSEGIAIHQSEGSSFGRFWTLWRAGMSGRLLPLDQIDEHYPKRVSDISLAYAEAADFVSFLIRKGGWLGIKVVIRNRSKGASFDEAIEESYKQGIYDIEKEWKKGLVTKWPWLFLVTGSGAVWGLMVLLFLAAYVSAKRRSSKRMSEMEEEDEMMDEIMREARNKRLGETQVSIQPSVRTKVRVDDDIHTLH